MNVLFILGNGFDINLGLHTSYQDFYDYYLKQPSNDEVIANLKKYLEQKRYTTWADLELGLGEYTARVDSVEKMRMICYDLGDGLKTHLNSEVNSFVVTDNCVKAISKGLYAPHDALALGMKTALNDFIQSQYPLFIDVISFNYTDTLEKIMLPVMRRNGAFILKDQVYLRSIKHIHMRLEDEDIIMGVNDDSQIVGRDLLNDELKRLLVKPYINQQLQTLIDAECIQLINNAGLICLFGVSVGLTDLMWWRAIGDKLQSSNSKIIMYTYGNSKVIHYDQRIGKYAESKALLFDRMGIKQTDDLNKRIYVGYNTTMFHVE